MKKKVLSMALCTVMTAVFLAGCGGGSSAGDQTSVAQQDGSATGQSADSKNQEGSASTGGKNIVVWTQFMDNEAELLQKYADQWGAETGNTVTVIPQQTDIQQFSQAANSADGPDGMLGIPNDQLANYVSANLAQEVPTDLYDDADFVEAAVVASGVNGKKYGVPLSVETPFLFYNTDKVSEVPATWEEMLEIAKDNGGIVYEATSVYYNLGMLRAFDSYIFNEVDGVYDTADIGLGNAGAVQAYEFVNKMANEYHCFSSDITYDLAKSSFQNGDAAFYIGGAWDVAGFTEAGTPFGVSDIPTLNGRDFVTPVGTYVGFVSSKSDCPDETFAFYKYIVDNQIRHVMEEAAGFREHIKHTNTKAIRPRRHRRRSRSVQRENHCRRSLRWVL
ncbi:MAG: extracellular solute-binding protein, partial [Lachnospiraceae bacterium]|nr:extracellular solute-binding protein [Lachnospiraceae bacterium]